MTENRTSQTLRELTDAELIEAVATEVMGWVKEVKPPNTRPMSKSSGSDGPKPESWVDKRIAWEDKDGRIVQTVGVWNPLTNWNHTMEVVSECEKRKFCILFEWQKNLGPWAVFIEPNPVASKMLLENKGRIPFEAYIQEEPFQRAICLAALKAVRSSSYE